MEVERLLKAPVISPAHFLDSFGCSRQSMRLLFKSEGLEDLKGEFSLYIRLIKQSAGNEEEIGYTDTVISKEPKWQQSIPVRRSSDRTDTGNVVYIAKLMSSNEGGNDEMLGQIKFEESEIIGVETDSEYTITKKING